jgi:hypothetical protein
VEVQGTIPEVAIEMLDGVVQAFLASSSALGGGGQWVRQLDRPALSLEGVEDDPRVAERLAEVLDELALVPQLPMLAVPDGERRYSGGSQPTLLRKAVLVKGGERETDAIAVHGRVSLGRHCYGTKDHTGDGYRCPISLITA